MKHLDELNVDIDEYEKQPLKNTRHKNKEINRH